MVSSSGIAVPVLSLVRTRPSVSRDGLGSALSAVTWSVLGVLVWGFLWHYFIVLSSSGENRYIFRNKCQGLCHSAYSLCYLAVGLQGKDKWGFVQPFPHNLGVGEDFHLRMGAVLQLPCVTVGCSQSGAVWVMLDIFILRCALWQRHFSRIHFDGEE